MLKILAYAREKVYFCTIFIRYSEQTTPSDMRFCCDC